LRKYVFQYILNVQKLTYKLQRTLAVLSTLTPCRQDEFIARQKATFRIAVLPFIGVKTRWNSTQELLKGAYQLRQFTCNWFKNPKYSNY